MCPHSAILHVTMAVYILLFLLCYSNLVEGTVYHIMPNSAGLCTVPCPNLTLFAVNFSNFINLELNTTMILFPGRHNLFMTLEIVNQKHFLMTSLNTSAQVICENSSSISFTNTPVVHIMNVEFIGCGHNQFNNVSNFTLANTRFEGKESSGAALELIKTNAQITNAVFLSNTKGIFRNLTKQLELIKKILGAQDIDLDTNGTWVGGALVAIHSNISIVSSAFESNSAEIGGGLFVESSSLTVENTTFINNYVHDQRSPYSRLGIAGVLYLGDSHTVLTNNHFGNNSASVGGLAFILRGSISTYSSNFSFNTAKYGGTLFSAFSDVVTQFDNNRAEYGGVLRSFTSNVTIENSQLNANNATFGGVILSFNSSLTINESEFSNNKAEVAGAVLVAAATTIKCYGYLLVTENSANEFGVMYLSECNVFFQGNATFSNNSGTLLAIYSNITFSELVAFTSNTQQHTTSVNFQDGGALSLFQSNVVFNGVCIFESNHAKNGGAIHSIESKLFVGGNMTLAYNQATRNGGGIYLSQSELSCRQQSILDIIGNTAVNRGGGIHAISSTVKSTTTDESNLRFLKQFSRRGWRAISGNKCKTLYTQAYSHQWW